MGVDGSSDLETPGNGGIGKAGVSEAEGLFVDFVAVLRRNFGPARVYMDLRVPARRLFRCLGRSNRSGLESLRSLLRLELDLLTLDQLAVPGAVDCRKVDEDILSPSFWGRNPKPFAALNHLTVPSAMSIARFSTHTLEGDGSVNQQRRTVCVNHRALDDSVASSALGIGPP